MRFDQMSDVKKVNAIRDEFVILLINLSTKTLSLKDYIPETSKDYAAISDTISKLASNCACGECIDTTMMNTNIIPAELEPLLDVARTLASTKSY